MDPLFWQIWQNPPKHVDPLFWLTILCESTKLAKCINSQEIYNLMNSLKSEKWQKVGFTSPLFAKLMVSHQPLRFTRASRVFRSLAVTLPDKLIPPTLILIQICYAKNAAIPVKSLGHRLGSVLCEFVSDVATGR